MVSGVRVLGYGDIIIYASFTVYNYYSVLDTHMKHIKCNPVVLKFLFRSLKIVRIT